MVAQDACVRHQGSLGKVPREQEFCMCVSYPEPDFQTISGNLVGLMLQKSVRKIRNLMGELVLSERP